MHGAIIADALRVPWKRLTFRAHIYEGKEVSEFKWKDWLHSINIFSHDKLNLAPNLNKFKYKIFPYLIKDKNSRELLKLLKAYNLEQSSLSSDDTITEITQKLKQKRKELIEKYL